MPERQPVQGGSAMVTRARVGFMLLIGALAASLLLPPISAFSARRVQNALPFASGSTSGCASLGSSYRELDLSVGATSVRHQDDVIATNDGALAVIVDIAQVDSHRHPVAIDFVASLRVPALIVSSANKTSTQKFDPPERRASGVTAADGKPIESLAFCYTLNLPAPPKAGQNEATSTRAAASPEIVAVQSVEPSVTETATIAATSAATQTERPVETESPTEAASATGTNT